MKALIQRVSSANVQVDGKEIGAIDKGILILLGIGKEDEGLTDQECDENITKLFEKISNLRIFANGEKPMDLSIKDIGGGLLVVSQFTLYGSTKKGRRPDFGDAALPEKARILYEKFVIECKKTGLKTETGEFGAMMDVSLVNDGPVTFMIES